jgi:hypothetical protein
MKPLQLPSAFLSLYTDTFLIPTTRRDMTGGDVHLDDTCASTKAAVTTANVKKSSRRLFSFNEARKIARGHGFDSHEEFNEYSCPGAYQIPKDANIVWATEWTSWEDFLGVPLSFHEGRNVARALEGIDTEISYTYLIMSKGIPDDHIASRLPLRPNLKYKSEWLGWNDFLIG